MVSGIRLEDLLRLQQEVIGRMALQSDLGATLEALCELVRDLVPGSLPTIMRLEPEAGDLRFLAAPGVDEELIATLDHLVPSEHAGSCGTAAFTGEVAIVEDTLTDPRWRELRSVAERFGIRACWSIPFFSPKNEVIGTFAISRLAPGGPQELELQLLRTAGQLAGIAVAFEGTETALREQKELLDSILEGTEDPIFAKDAQGRYLLVNSAEARGVRESREAMVGLRDVDLYPAEIAHGNERTDAEVQASGRGLHYEQEYDNPIEGKRTFLIRKGPLLGTDGRPKGVVGIARDITALKRAEEAMRQTQKLESLGVLAGGIAHDFNNLLTGILGNAELLLEGRVPGTPIQSSLLEIKKAAIRASELTNQMLAYSGKGDFVKRVVRLPELVDEVADLLASSISKKAELLFDVEQDLPSIEADPTQLRQLVLNILTNASEALEDRPGKIRVRMRSTGHGEVPRMHAASARVSKSDRYVVLEVTDDGSGMDEETRERIFDPFFTTKFAGRGLGLAAVQGIVRGHGGAITVTSHPGLGTTFAVYLPATERIPESHTLLPHPRTSWRGRGRVLVADDEEAVRKLASKVLQEAGLEVRTAVDGQDAVDIFEREFEEIAVVILDLTTPRLSGHEAWRRLRAIRADVPIILSSGYTERDATQAFGERDLAGFLQKPYLPGELVEVVRRVL